MKSAINILMEKDGLDPRLTAIDFMEFNIIGVVCGSLNTPVFIMR